MKKHYLQCLMLIGLIGVSSCNDKNDEFDDEGTATIVSLDAPASAYMGDSIAITFKVADDGEVALATSKIQLLYGEEIVSERIMLTGQPGEYTGKVLVPFLKNIPDGDATLKLRLKNARYAPDVKDADIAVSRPQFPYLILKVADGRELHMTPTSGKPNQYAVTANFSSEQSAYIVAPKYGENGNEMPFGNADGKITNGISNNIEFTSDTDGEYQITFNTMTFEGTPFIKFALNEQEFNKRDDDHWYVDMDLQQGQEIQITGLKSDYANYWIDPTFFDVKKNSNRKVLKFRAMDGKYRVTVNKNLKYFNVDMLNGTSLSTFNKDKGEGALWMLGGGGIGKPSFGSNGINWGPNDDKSICVALLKKGQYQIILEAGRVLNTGDVNFKYFGQNGWGMEMNSSLITTTSPFVRINSGSSDDGNIFGGSQPFVSGKFYILTLNLPANFPSAPSVLTIEEVDTLPEVE